MEHTVGMVFYTYPSLHLALDSIKYVGRSLIEAASGRYNVAYLPPNYVYSSSESCRRMAEDFVKSCDILVGVPSEPILAARQRTGSEVPFLGFLLGVMPRGGWPLKGMTQALTTNDLLVANSTAEQLLARTFFRNARVGLIPFPFDNRVFYPLDEQERKLVRKKLGFRRHDRIVLYAGRITLEKNVHTVLRLFSVVQKLISNAHLVIVGPTMGSGFMEFGVLPLNLQATVKRIISKLRIPGDRIHLLGRASGDHLRELYNISDVKLNMTLHHDENFGLAQVEAMGCGLPVVGTAWGGLKDTIVDGISGYKISTVPTISGVKVNWWEAANRVLEVLQDASVRERFRASCVQHARANYSESEYRGAIMESIAATIRIGSDRPGRALRASAFAEEFWSVCNPYISDAAPYRRGRRSQELYKELMLPFTESSPASVSGAEELLLDHVLCLAAPISNVGEGRFLINDPIYPETIDVPPRYCAPFETILAAMRDRPVTSFYRLSQTSLNGMANARETLVWMLNSGILLRTRPVPEWISPDDIDGIPSEPLFEIQRLDRMSTDIIVY